MTDEGPDSSSTKMDADSKPHLVVQVRDPWSGRLGDVPELERESDDPARDMEVFPDRSELQKDRGLTLFKLIRDDDIKHWCDVAIQYCYYGK
jgi:hypothetical protein